jgi:hypothetical protein
MKCLASRYASERVDSFMEFMGISVGILALICALALLFGVQGTRKILGWAFGLLIFGGLGLAAIVWAWSTYQHSTGQANEIMATPLGILPAPPSAGANNYPDETLVVGPDHRTFRFTAGTEKTAIENYLKVQYGGPDTPRGDCWIKEPGPWCPYRALK